LIAAGLHGPRAIEGSFLETQASARRWERIPWLRLFQFPWRMMGPLALVASALAALLAALALAGRSPRVRTLAEVGFMVVALANAWPLV
jgi:lipopolysaccharide export LptBFGC system permease protein LptF